MAIKTSNLILSLALFVTGAVALLAAAVFVLPAPGKQQAQTSSVGGAFEMRDHTGARITDRDLKGMPFLVFFGFTHCPDICPTKLFEISEVLNALGRDSERVSALFVSVDPERDTQEVLARYISSFNPRIRALTGTREEIDAMIKTYRAYYRKVPTEDGGYTMDHTAVVYLMDGDGAFVAPVNLDKPAAAVADEVRRLL